MAAKLTAVQKLQRQKEPKRVQLEAAFGGMKTGDKMYVATPLIVDEYVREIPVGETRTIPLMRQELAKLNDCDGACPLSSSIFVRMVAEAAIEEMSEGKLPSDVAPFWRLISREDKIAKKLTVDAEWLDEQRALEAAS